MKIRTGFVSNSSSSSFIIYKKDLTCAQIQLIHSHSDVAGDDAWSIEDREELLSFHTWMDNFSMVGYLRSIGVGNNVIENMDNY